VSRLETLAAPFEDVKLRFSSRSVELRLPPVRPYAGSVASRAAEACFLSLGCSPDSTFTIHCEGGFDPLHELEVTERAADASSGWIKRFLQWRTRSIKASLSDRRRPPKGPAA
jgi:hypothetical protein